MKLLRGILEDLVSFEYFDNVYRIVAEVTYISLQMHECYSITHPRYRVSLLRLLANIEYVFMRLHLVLSGTRCYCLQTRQSHSAPDVLTGVLLISMGNYMLGHSNWLFQLCLFKKITIKAVHCAQCSFETVFVFSTTYITDIYIYPYTFICLSNWYTQYHDRHSDWICKISTYNGFSNKVIKRA